MRLLKLHSRPKKVFETRGAYCLFLRNDLECVSDPVLHFYQSSLYFVYVEFSTFLKTFSISPKNNIGCRIAGQTHILVKIARIELYTNKTTKL